MDTTTHLLKFSELQIDPDSVANMMGYKEDVPEQILEMIDSEMKSFNNADGIMGGYRILDAKLYSETKSVGIEDKSFNIGKSVWSLLKNSEQIALFICTAGATISERARYLMDKGDILEGYVVDVIGSVTAEKAMDKIQNYIKEIVSQQNFHITNRYSPGYCDWNVAEQQHLFSFFPDNFCNVRLNASALMLPIKSVSGFIGIGPNVKYRNYSCNICTQVNCLYGNKKK